MQTEEYQKLAEMDDRMWYFRSLHAHVVRELKRYARDRATIRVLDAGCGAGGLLLALKASHPEWKLTGLDFSELACEMARARTGLEIVQGSITALPFADGSFNAVVFADVIQQVDDPSLALNEARRVLAPGGLLVVNAAAYRWLWSYHDDVCQTRHRFTRPELSAMATTVGLTVTFASYRNTVLFPLIVLKRKLARGQTTSDVGHFPYVIDRVLGALVGPEHFALATRLALPFGCSVFLVAQRAG